MGISIDPSDPSREGGLPKLSAEAIAKLVALDCVGAAFKAYEEIKRYRTDETLEQKVWTLWRESLAIALPEWARKVAPEHLRDDERLRERLDRAFERGFRRAFADRDEHFAELRKYFAGDEAETGNRRYAWGRYYDGLSPKIEEEPLFNQPEDGSGATRGRSFSLFAAISGSGRRRTERISRRMAGSRMRSISAGCNRHWKAGWKSEAPALRFGW